ncbi:MAG TPA: hypothetical protein PLL30_08435 [Candidatus Krumholzibacteria bacterium]|nr:hypothetical protein [Candidatus Krumholzibacteria bacterium]HPD71785.1 hypothetical protein [Candidatus Krumholzibacteria bacterium]HRY41282.1 hypothetical protein [Candidatus Krumholzibacteria bacterium]
MRTFFDRSAVLAALLVATSAVAASAEVSLPARGADFRNVDWGASRQLVRQSERPAPVVNDGPLLVFPATVCGQPCQIVYFFQDDRLCLGFYQWSDTHDDLDAYFADAAARRDELAAAWGEPQIEKWDWEDPMFAEDPSLRAEALGLGLVRYELGWMAGRSIVALRMSGGNLEGDILVMYADRTCFPTGQDAFADFFARRVGVPTPYYR